ncbi:DUF6984 family protein [Cyclobacterium plantarum]|uniref:DUF6984 family protein n=1 Tax=Cyclobacterium plantarum TaxID=2716263 RepID=UPI003F711DD5
MVYSRVISEKEAKLLDLLIKKAGLVLPSDWKSKLLVRPMKDDGMGSLLFFPKGEIKENREFGEQISECQFEDKDGVEIIASLNLDKEGELFELDIWKTNFGPLKSFPDL